MTRDASLIEMVQAMSHLPDETVFRWYQCSEVDPSRGSHEPGDTLRVTLGQIRRDLGLSPE